MMLFFLDACAVARKYLTDIGSSNINRMFNYPDSVVVSPRIVKPEVISTIISSYNGGFISYDEMEICFDLFDKDLRTSEVLILDIDDVHYNRSMNILKRHKITKSTETGTGKGRIGGADAIYLAMAIDYTKRLEGSGDKLIFVTSDNALYRCAVDEPDLEVFHFWTCRCSSCGRITIPQKGVTSVCESCGRVCDRCEIGRCNSDFSLDDYLEGRYQ